MLPQFKKFRHLAAEEQDKISLYLNKFWEMAEELGISGLKIDETEILLEHSLMGFLPPVECLERIKQIFPIHPEKGELLIEEIKKKIFPNLRNELARMYSPEKIGFIIGKKEERTEKILDNKEEKPKGVSTTALGDFINIKEEKPKESKESLSEEKKKIEEKKPSEDTLGNYLELK